VQGILANPQLFLFNEARQVIASTTMTANGGQVSEIQSSGFAPSSATEIVLSPRCRPASIPRISVNNTTEWRWSKSMDYRKLPH